MPAPAIRTKSRATRIDPPSPFQAIAAAKARHSTSPNTIPLRSRADPTEPTSSDSVPRGRMTPSISRADVQYAAEKREAFTTRSRTCAPLAVPRKPNVRHGSPSMGRKPPAANSANSAGASSADKASGATNGRDRLVGAKLVVTPGGSPARRWPGKGRVALPSRSSTLCPQPRGLRWEPRGQRPRRGSAQPVTLKLSQPRPRFGIA